MSKPICRCWYDHEQYKITTDCPTHSNNSAVAYLRAEVEELRKDRERLEWLFTNAYYVYSMNGPNGEEYFYVYDSNGTQISEFHCDGPREAIDRAIEAAAKGGE